MHKTMIFLHTKTICEVFLLCREVCGGKISHLHQGNLTTTPGISEEGRKLSHFFVSEEKKQKRFLMYADMDVARWEKKLKDVFISSIVVATSTFLPWRKFCLFLFCSAPLLCKKFPWSRKKEFRSCFARQGNEVGAAEADTHILL